jgi:hypothetical protein
VESDGKEIQRKYSEETWFYIQVYGAPEKFQPSAFSKV